ncbi:hypothetical protein EV182_004208 [Spiromyces aspiralis]|uniref:Uncharacterized protein n=1 Tax=Spiromyces aspiralis TaxID=68401 RepID=A0ACC1HBQ8_9FUNG|nr:hypothetical protein EV182_004208 [Spiromyces aspiralis]
MSNTAKDSASTTGSQLLDKLLANNRVWSEGLSQVKPGYFEQLSKGQSPEILWIGCSDSRVCVETLTKADPGQVFVHRNIANRMIIDDNASHSVVEFAVRFLGVKHIVVAGHTHCGGVKGALSGESLGLLDEWLRPIKQVYEDNKAEIDALSTAYQRENKLSELNVINSINNIAKMPSIQDAWAKGKPLAIHGMIFQIETGLLKDLNVTVSKPQQ